MHPESLKSHSIFYCSRKTFEGCPPSPPSIGQASETQRFFFCSPGYFLGIGIHPQDGSHIVSRFVGLVVGIFPVVSKQCVSHVILVTWWSGASWGLDPIQWILTSGFKPGLLAMGAFVGNLDPNPDSMPKLPKNYQKSEHCFNSARDWMAGWV